MAESTVSVLFAILGNLINSTLDTMGDMLGLSWNLLGSLSIVSAQGGITGIGVVLLIISVVGFLLAKFFLGSVKTLMKLAFVAVVIIALLIIGYSIA